MTNLLFTGASGFLGKNIKPLLEKEYSVTTIGIDPTDHIQVNLAKETPTLQNRYDVVLHAAGKAHVVPKSEEEVQAFYDVNLQGTKNLCASLEEVGVPKSLVFISTVAVYGCESGVMIDEQHPLNGRTPYALSKIEAEEFLRNWCQMNGVVLSILRPSLIAGVSAPGNLGAMVSGIEKGRYLSIGKGQARKSVLMAQDIATLIPLLEAKGGIYNICDNVNPSFRELEEIISKQLNKGMPISIPYWIAKLIAIVGDVVGRRFPINSDKLTKITSELTFSNRKAKEELNWTPTDVLRNYIIR